MVIESALMASMPADRVLELWFGLFGLVRKCIQIISEWYLPLDRLVSVWPHCWYVAPVLTDAALDRG